MDTTVYEKLLAASFRFVSYRPRSEKELRDFLNKKLIKRKIIDATVVQKVIDRLIELDYVDDAKFASWWIEQRHTFRPRGRRVIFQELRQKEISRELLEDIAIEPETERASAMKAIAKKLSLWRKFPLLELKQKVSHYLFQRGFTSDTISRVIDEIGKKE